MEIAEVVCRWQSGNSQRQIESGTGLSRATVRRYIVSAMGAGLTRDGPGASEDHLSRLSGLNLSSPRKVEAPTEEMLAPWADQIREWLSSDRLQLPAGITDPFSSTELIARVEASLRKRIATGETMHRQPCRLGELTIDYADWTVTVSDNPVQLSATEYRLLFELSISAGRVLTHDQILQSVWGQGMPTTSHCFAPH